VPPPPELPQPVAPVASATSPPATITPLIRLANIIEGLLTLFKLERPIPRRAAS
jgi:hypothetical protein